MTRPYPHRERAPIALRRCGLAALACLALACAHAPSIFPARSAASPEALPAELSVVARAVTEEPPLPGGSTEGWDGLATPASTDPHAGHHMHHAGMTPPPESADAPSDAAHPGSPPEASHDAH